MKAAPNLDFTHVDFEKTSFHRFVQMIRNVYQNLVTLINGNIGFGDGTTPDNISGNWINVVTPVAPNTDFTVNHNLQRLPVGYWIMQKDRACDVYTGSVAATTTQLTLRATVASAVLRLFIIGILLGLFSTISYAQGAGHRDVALISVNTSAGSGMVKIVPSAVITVCNGATLPPDGSACTGTASIFSDVALSKPLPNPTNADARGNYVFFAAAGQNYVVSVGGAGVSTYSYVWVAPLVASGSLTVSSLTSTSANPALTTFIRMASTDCLSWRDNFNVLDESLCKDSNERLKFNGGFVPVVVFSTPSTSTNASILGITMGASGNIANTFRVSFYVDQTVLGTGCSTNTTIGLSVAFNDPNVIGSTVQTVGTTITIVNNGTVGTVLTPGNIAGSWTYIFRSKVSTPVSYNAAYTVGTCTTGPSYQVYPILEQLN